MRDHLGDLGDFLRSRRGRVDPASAGIPVDRRRRVEGLRREEVAHLAGISVDYYVRLEQGRARQPSAQVLDALARVLGLHDVETAHLHRLAEHPRRAAPTPRQDRVRPELRRLLDIMGDVPALVVNHRLDVLAANGLAVALYDGFGVRPPQRGNLARHVFLCENADGLYPEWETCTLDGVGHLRFSAGKYPDDERLAALIGELSMRSERFRKLWAQAGVCSRTHGRKVFRHPQVGMLELHQENFALPDGSGQELIVLTAAQGSEAETGLRLLASLAATGAPATRDPADAGRGRPPATP